MPVRPFQPSITGRDPRWPARLLELVAELREGGDGPGAEAVRAEVWVILSTALILFCRGHARSMPWIDRDDIHDLASEKTLDLLVKLESRTWDPSGRPEDQIRSYLSTVARNGLVGLIKQAERSAALIDTARNTEGPPPAALAGGAAPASAEDQTERQAFAQDLLGCLRGLKDRAARVWFMKVMLEVPSKEIAMTVAARADNIDVIFLRASRVIGDCMKRKGHDTGPLPAGTFAALWTEYWGRKESKRYD